MVGTLRFAHPTDSVYAARTLTKNSSTALHAGLGVEFAGVRQHFGRRLAGRRRRRGDTADMGGNLVRSGRYRLNVASDLAGGAALLLDGGRDRDRDLAHLP